jgi:hypothetical protein
MQVAKKTVSGKQPTEKQHFGGDKAPHAELGRLALMGEIDILHLEHLVGHG